MAASCLAVAAVAAVFAQGVLGFELSSESVQYCCPGFIGGGRYSGPFTTYGLQTANTTTTSYDEYNGRCASISCTSIFC